MYDSLRKKNTIGRGKLKDIGEIMEELKKPGRVTLVLSCERCGKVFETETFIGPVCPFCNCRQREVD